MGGVQPAGSFRAPAGWKLLLCCKNLLTVLLSGLEQNHLQGGSPASRQDGRGSTFSILRLTLHQSRRWFESVIVADGTFGRGGLK